VPLDVTRQRLRNQRLSGPRVARPADVVRWLGAVQAQEYADAKWAIALRTRRASESAIERGITNGSILRTHVLRPTWHFVAAADIRWMLALTGPRVSARMAPYNRHLELDTAVFRRSERAIVRALRGGAYLTRQELRQALHEAGVRADNVQRLAHLVMQVEIDGVICSGPRRGNRFTYALLDERVPAVAPLSRDEALAELTRRYFRSRGPAQLADFTWWSGLTTGDARRGLAIIERDVERVDVDGKAYWVSRARATGERARSAFLLGLYDEYLIAYKDRSAALDRSRWTRAIRDAFAAPIVMDGQVVGGWRRTTRDGTMTVALTPMAPFDRRAMAAVESAAHAYATFFGLELRLTTPSSARGHRR
jgi:hypothetical protein